MLVVFGGGGRWRGSSARYPPTTDNRPQSPCLAEPLTRNNTPTADSRRVWALPVLWNVGGGSGVLLCPRKSMVKMI